MTQIVFHVTIFEEEDSYVALCPELNVSSFGESVSEARRSVTEAVEAFLEECETMGTLKEVLEESGFVMDAQGHWRPRRPVAAEEIALSR